MLNEEVKYFIVDWGTTNFRAFAMDQSNKVIDTKSSHEGLLNIQEGAFAQTLEDILKPWVANYTQLPIYMAGMVGSAKGWKNVDYVSTPATSDKLGEKTYRFNLPWGACAFIVPGVSHAVDHEQYDVMRGEEVQIVGLSLLSKQHRFNAILPGTHSKHVTFSDNALIRFSSYLTGEIYSILLGHSLLGKGVTQASVQDDAIFLKGVKDIQNKNLVNKLFLNWTHRLFGNLTPEQISDYLSGMLIGYELQHVTEEQLFLVGSKSLCSKYSLALNALGIKGTIVDGNECFIAGMIALKNSINS